MKLVALASLCLALVSGCVTTQNQQQQCCQKAGSAECCKTGKTCPMTKSKSQCATCPTTKAQQ